MYRPIPRGKIADDIAYLRELYRKATPKSDREVLARERREIVAKNLLSNLLRTKEHPTLNTVLEIADTFALTLDGAHRLFGYELSGLRKFDLTFNGGTTHIIESYAFERDLLVDLPSRLGTRGVGSIATMGNLVADWQRDVPIRSVDEEPWKRPGAFYVQVGSEDSLGSSLPPGSIALVEPITQQEQQRPNPRTIYLLQFGNGYRCSRCIARGSRLLLLTSGRHYKGPQEFEYPGKVRIAGRARMFALDLPSSDVSLLRPPPPRHFDIPLILPWEQPSLDRLLASEYDRSTATGYRNLSAVREGLEAIFRSKVSARTERRYRRPTTSLPHTDSLMQLAMLSVVRYTDALRAAGALPSDQKRFSLETLLNANSLDDVVGSPPTVPLPAPTERWESFREDFVEWPTLLSMRFPRLHALEDRVVRLGRSGLVQGLEPPLSSGTMALLERVVETPDVVSENRKTGWSRPMYALRRGADVFLGHLKREGNLFALLSTAEGIDSPITFVESELPHLSRVTGVAVPL